jgi:asparagine synthase (glutamine-hydrolysing)
MCGIAGVFGHTDGHSLMRVTENMVASLVHRGPDDGGVWVDDDAIFTCGKIASPKGG